MKPTSICLPKWIVISAILLPNLLQSQILGTYEFTGTGACPHVNTAVTAQPANAVFSAFSSVNTTCTASNDVFNNKAWNSGTTVDLAEYNEFRIFPGNCYRLDLVSLSFEHKLSTGTANWHVRSNLDGFAADFFTGSSTSAQSMSTMALPAEFTNVDTLIIRFYITGIAIGTTTWRQDNVTVSGTVNPIVPVNYYLDNDGDGFGSGIGTLMCSNPGGYSLNDEDCNDNDFEIHPSSIWYADLDDDGFGDSNIAETGCTSSLTNATLESGDCDDDNNLLHPMTIWYEDADSDGFGDPGNSETACESTFLNPVLVSGDCNDDEPSVYPNAPEICDAFDNDCNNQVNDGLTFSTYYIDADHDGFGTESAGSFCDDPGVGYASMSGDCNDNNPNAYPSAMEIIGNGVDENCDLTDGYLGINELNSAVLKVFPNPGNDLLTISFSNSLTIQKINLYSISGILITSFNLPENQQTLKINTQNLTPGMYLIEVSNEKTYWIKN